jgi:hypothetical protein
MGTIYDLCLSGANKRCGYVSASIWDLRTHEEFSSIHVIYYER